MIPAVRACIPLFATTPRTRQTHGTPEPCVGLTFFHGGMRTELLNGGLLVEAGGEGRGLTHRRWKRRCRDDQAPALPTRPRPAGGLRRPVRPAVWLPGAAAWPARLPARPAAAPRPQQDPDLGMTA